MIKSKSTIGKDLLKLRKNTNLSQRDISDLIGVAQTNLSMIERGVRIPNSIEYDAICKLFDVKNKELNLLLKNKRIGKNIRYIRTQNCLSEREIANMCGLNKKDIVRIEKGQIDLENSDIVSDKLFSCNLFNKDQILYNGIMFNEEVNVECIKAELDAEEDRFVESISNKVSTNILDKIEETIIGYLDGKDVNPFESKYSEIKYTMRKVLIRGMNYSNDISQNDRSSIIEFMKEYLYE